MGATTREQTSFRIRDDDGSESAATWRQAINVDDTLAVDTNFRIRFGYTIAGMNGAQDCQLEYNLASAGWNPVNATSSVVRSSASSNVADNATITEQLDQGKTFTANTTPNGGFDEVDGLVASQSLLTTEECEVEYCFQIRSADVTDAQTLQLRITRAGTVFDTYTNTPTITVDETSGDISLSPGNASLTLTAATPTLGHSEDHQRDPAAAALALGTTAPALLRTDDHPLEPGAAALAFSGAAPAIGASFIAAKNADWSQAVDTKFRVRIEVKNTGGVAVTPAFKWQYNRNAAGWNDVTAVSSVVRTADSGYFTDADDTVQLLGTDTFPANNNAAEEATGTFTLGVNLAGQEVLESEACLTIVGGDVADSDTIDLRLVESDGTAFGTYAQTPTITVSEAGDISLSPAAASIAFATNAPALDVTLDLLLSPANQNLVFSTTAPGLVVTGIAGGEWEMIPPWLKHRRLATDKI